MSGGLFARAFGREAPVRTRAHGRVNLIGEHTDYSGGFVLPLAIPQRCTAELGPAPGHEVRLWSANRESDGAQAYRLGREERRGTWVDYVQGVTRAAAAHGCALSGFELALSSNVPAGAGLSSSAALEIAVLRALRDTFAWDPGDVALARIAREAENEFVGAPVGIMDPMAASLATCEAALFLDTRSRQFEHVAIPAEAEIAVIDSGVVHDHVVGDYRTRRSEVDRAALLAGVGELRELFDYGDSEKGAALPSPLDRRVRHVLTENRRVLEMVDALRAGDLGRAGQLLKASHQSLRDDFEVSIPELDLLVELAAGLPEVFGARMTGGGFGGSVLLLTTRGAASVASATVARQYAVMSGREASVLVPRPSDPGDREV